MNEWLVGAVGLMVLLVPAGLLSARGDVLDRIVGMQLASTIGVLALLLLAEGFQRDVYFDLAVIASVMSVVGTLFFIHIYESWL
jgi:multicomponent Na+:H+ antiporter subunit F